MELATHCRRAVRTSRLNCGRQTTLTVNTQIASDVVDDRVAIKGENTEVLAHVAQPIGLVIHELVSNAQNHGALKDDEGFVSLNWIVHADSLILQWREAVSAPKIASITEGFGLQIVRTVVEDQLRRVPTIEMCGNVLEATFVIPGAIARQA